MSVRRKKAGLAISWRRSFSLLAPWRKGRADGDAVLDGKVVLTNMKLLTNIHQRLSMSDDSLSTVSTVSNCDVPDPSTAPGVEPGPESGYLSAILSKSQLPRLYKFESEDSGVELPSGANSPSTPTASEQSFVVHSRESSFASGQGPADSLPEQAQTRTGTRGSGTTADDQNTVTVPPGGFRPVTAERHFTDKAPRSGAAAAAGRRRDPPSQTYPDGGGPGRRCDDGERVRSGAAGGGLDAYMEECCRLSQAQPATFYPLGSGLGYLEHICQLSEKIGQLQDANLRLQRQIFSLQKDGQMTKTKEGFFQQRCSCGAARLAFQDPLPGECLSPSGTMSDLTTIPEVSRCPLTDPRAGTPGGGATLVPLWRRSYTEGEVHFLGKSPEGPAPPPYRLGDNYTLGRFKEIMRKTKLRNHSRLGLISSPLKMSCPQLYRPDLGPAEAAGRNRASMMSLGHDSRLDFSFLQ